MIIFYLVQNHNSGGKNCIYFTQNLEHRSIMKIPYFKLIAKPGDDDCRCGEVLTLPHGFCFERAEGTFQKRI